jgi:hypothetical protein
VAWFSCGRPSADRVLATQTVEGSTAFIGVMRAPHMRVVGFRCSDVFTSSQGRAPLARAQCAALNTARSKNDLRLTSSGPPSAGSASSLRPPKARGSQGRRTRASQGIPAARVPPGLRMLRDVGAHRVIREVAEAPQQRARDRYWGAAGSSSENSCGSSWASSRRRSSVVAPGLKDVVQRSTCATASRLRVSASSSF